MPSSDPSNHAAGSIKIHAPSGIRPIGNWWDEFIVHPCEGCRADVLARFVLPSEDVDQMFSPHAWLITVAHHDGCQFRILTPLADH